MALRSSRESIKESIQASTTGLWRRPVCHLTGSPHKTNKKTNKHSKQDFSTNGWDLELGFSGLQWSLPASCTWSTTGNRPASTSGFLCHQVSEYQERSKVQNCLRKDERKKKGKRKKILSACGRLLNSNLERETQTQQQLLDCCLFHSPENFLVTKSSGKRTSPTRFLVFFFACARAHFVPSECGIYTEQTSDPSYVAIVLFGCYWCFTCRSQYFWIPRVAQQNLSRCGNRSPGYQVHFPYAAHCNELIPVVSNSFHNLHKLTEQFLFISVSVDNI